MQNARPDEQERDVPPKDKLRKVHPEEEERGKQVDPNRPNDRDD